MRIAQIAPLEMRVPPKGYGGTELIVSLLTEELVRRGHEVTLFASGDSATRAKLSSVYPVMLRGSGLDEREALIYRTWNIVSCLEQAHGFDIVHNHGWPEALALLANLIDVPMLTTLHGNPGSAERALLQAYKGYYNAISRSQKAMLPDKGCVGVIHNAIDCKSYSLGPEKRDGYLLFLSRINKEKGAHIAIQVAKRLKRRLIIAGNVDTVDEEYFRKLVLPQVDGDLIQYFGEADYQQKRELLSHAHCLLAPITWPEPFGLFMVEAMACGTPVIAFDHGAAPEIVVHGETGFIVHSVEEMVEAVGEVHHIDHKLCREHVERHFDVPRMVDDYVAAYERILETRRAAAQIPAHISTLPPHVAGGIILDKNSTGTKSNN